jgi:hypothetical protein
MQAHVHSPGFWEYSGGWNAVSHRFKAVADADRRFRTGLDKSDRYIQEAALFDFFG